MKTSTLVATILLSSSFFIRPALSDTYFYTYTVASNATSWKTSWKDASNTPIDVEASAIITQTISDTNYTFTFAGGNSYDGNATSRGFTYHLNGVNNNNVYVKSSDNSEIIFQNFYAISNPALFYTNSGNLFIGDNVSILNNKSTFIFGFGGIIGSDKGHIILGNNFNFIGNTTTSNQIGTFSSYNGSISFGDNALIKDNTTNDPGEVLGGIIYADKNLLFGNNAKFINNKLITTTAASGGAVFMYKGDMVFGNISSPNSVTEFINNSASSNTSIASGGALASYGNVTINGNANFTGNTVYAPSTSNARGGAITIWTKNTDSIPDPTLKFNLNSGNHVLFRDNNATYGASIYTYPNVTFEINNNGGIFDIYDSSYFSTGAKFVQNGIGSTNLWNTHTIVGNIEINDGSLSLQKAVILPNTIDATPTTYDAGKIETNGNFILGTNTGSSAVLNIFDGAELDISGTGTFTMMGNAMLNLHNGSIFSVASNTVNIGNDNIINLAPLGVSDKRLAFKTFNINNLGQGNTFILNSDLENNSSDTIELTNLPSGTNKIKINYDPLFDLNRSANGIHATTIVDGPIGSDFEIVGVDTDYGVRRFTPQIRKNGDTWELYSLDRQGEPGSDPRPSQTVEGAEALAMAQSAIVVQYATNQTLNRRMGELRNIENSSGAWIRGAGGENKIKHIGNQQYYMGQVGIDFDHQTGEKAKLFTGVAIENINANSNLPIGKADTELTGASLYATWVRQWGDYFDLVLKSGQLSSDMKTSTLDGELVKADYNTWVNTASLEYGYRIKVGCDGYYLQPETQFTIGRANSVSYHTDNNIKIKQNEIDMAIGRLGLTFGKQINDTNIFTSLNAYKNYAGKTKIVASDNITSLSLQDSMKGSWADVTVGANSKLTNALHTYFEASTGLGGTKVQNNWSLNFGFRYDF